MRCLHRQGRPPVPPCLCHDRPLSQLLCRVRPASTRGVPAVAAPGCAGSGCGGGPPPPLRHTASGATWRAAGRLGGHNPLCRARHTACTHELLWRLGCDAAGFKQVRRGNRGLEREQFEAPIPPSAASDAAAPGRRAHTPLRNARTRLIPTTATTATTGAASLSSDAHPAVGAAAPAVPPPVSSSRRRSEAADAAADPSVAMTARTNNSGIGPVDGVFGA